VPAELDPAIGAGDKVYVCIRPEKLQLRTEGERDGGRINVEGTVVETVYLGTATQFLIEVAPEVRVVAIQNNVHTASHDDRPQQGTKLTIGWLPEHGRILRS
jgi:ABC-type Fe3+/spermidine/putrescine transport system ATPase subunit